MRSGKQCETPASVRTRSELTTAGLAQSYAGQLLQGRHRIRTAPCPLTLTVNAAARVPVCLTGLMAWNVLRRERWRLCAPPGIR